jgi:hypothetical protein
VSGQIRADAVICCLITGTGFKDSHSVVRMIGDQPCPMLDLKDLASLPR